MEISWSSLWRIFFMLVLVSALFLVREVLVIIFLAVVISSALDSPVSFLERKKLPRILGTILVFIAILIALSLVLYTIIPVGIIELKNLLREISKIEIPVFGSLDASNVIQKLDQATDNLGGLMFSGGTSFVNIITSVFGNLLLIIVTFVLSFYLTVNRGGVEAFLRAILPITQEDYVIRIYHQARRKLGLWLQGQILLMAIVGALVSVGLWILGVDYSLILGILAGLLEIVPVAGPIFAGTAAFLVAVSESWTLGLYTILLFVVIQPIENHLLVPLVMRKTVGISPVVVVISILAGSYLAGFVGIILAVPTAVVFQEILKDWEERKLKIKGGRIIE
jgi:predicted PurR-regulated permease PerM